MSPYTLSCSLLLLALLAGAACADTTEIRRPTADPDRRQQLSFEERQQSFHWPTYGGRASGTQYSNLSQINLDNVDQLEVAWTYHAGDLSAGDEQADATLYQVTPIHANNRLYLCTPFNDIVALDPGTGEEIWRYHANRKLTDAFYGSNYCRGVAYWEGGSWQEQDKHCGKRILQTTQFGVLLAVDADTGKLCEMFGDGGKIDLNTFNYRGKGKIHSTSPPAIYFNVVITGGSTYDNAESNSPDGIVRAFEIRTGQELWSWNPIPPQLRDKTGGANTWAPISIDQERGLVFLPTGSPSHDLLGTNRIEPIADANAVVALKATTGKKIWSYQTIHHDLWDYDLPSMPTLATLPDGRDVVIQATKTGFLFILDRDTGEPIFPVEEVPAPKSDVPGEYTSPTQPVPTLPAPFTSTNITPEDAWGVAYFDKRACRKKLENLRNEGIFTPPSRGGSVLHPSFLGGSNWGGVAYDEQAGIAVINSSNLVSAVQLFDRENFDPKRDIREGFSFYPMNGSPYHATRGALLSPLGLGWRAAPCNPPPWGQLTGIDVASGKTLWQVPFGRIELFPGIKSPAAWGSPNQGGPIVTAGGLIFIGASPDRLLRAYDTHTGELVWKGKIPAPAMATPMTYAHGPRNRQYVLIAAGGHEQFHTKKSDAIVAYALPP